MTDVKTIEVKTVVSDEAASELVNQGWDLRTSFADPNVKGGTRHVLVSPPPKKTIGMGTM